MKTSRHLSAAITRCVNGNWFSTISRKPLYAVAILVALTVFFSFPSYDIATVLHEMDENWQAVFLQVKEPFKDHLSMYAAGSHADKLAFRFVPALALKIVRIKSITGGLIFQFATLILFYGLLIRLFYDLFETRQKALFFALPICFVISGHVYASDYRGMFDTLALDFILLALLLRNRPYVIIALLLAYFTDERALIASGPFFLINLFEKNTSYGFHAIVRSIFLRSNLYLCLSWILYVAIRFGLHGILGLTSGTGGMNLFLDQLNRTFYTLYIGMEGFWIVGILILFKLFKTKQIVFSVLIILSFLSFVLVAQSVLDINRSMAYALPLLILFLMLLNRLYPPDKTFAIVAIVIAVNLAYDDFYPLPAQLYRMKYITHSF